MHPERNKNRDKNMFFIQPLRVQKVPDFRGKSILFAGGENLTSHLCGGWYGVNLTNWRWQVRMDNEIHGYEVTGVRMHV